MNNTKVATYADIILGKTTWGECSEELQEWFKEGLNQRWFEVRVNGTQCWLVFYDTSSGMFLDNDGETCDLYNDNNYQFCEINFLPPRIEPRFKVGDRVKLHKEVLEGSDSTDSETVYMHNAIDNDIVLEIKEMNFNRANCYVINMELEEHDDMRLYIDERYLYPHIEEEKGCQHKWVSKKVEDTRDKICTLCGTLLQYSKIPLAIELLEQQGYTINKKS